MSSVPDGPQYISSPKQDPEPKKRQSSWTCRLPVELLSVVLEYLTEDKALGTLAAVQTTSRATYTIATPYLYRNIIIDTDQALSLFNQFADFPGSENRLICQPVPADTHLLDLHLYQRLRAYLSHTKTLSLDLTVGRNTDWFACDRLNRYKELVNGLLAFGESSLWSSLEYCSLNMNPDRELQTDFYCYDRIPVVDAVFASMHPKRFSITYFAGSKLRDTSYTHSWTPCIQRLKADRFELFGMVFGDGLPFAKLSMTIHYNHQCSNPSFVGESDFDNNFHALELDSQALNEIDDLKLVGLAGPLDHGLSSNVHDMSEIMDLSLDRLEELAGWRGPQKDLKVTIQSDNSPEGEAGAVSRVFKPQS